MKILKHKSDQPPINLLPGDSMVLTYKEIDESGKTLFEQKCAEATVDTAMVITEFAITEHESVADLNMGRAIAGWFGEKAIERKA